VKALAAAVAFGLFAARLAAFDGMVITAAGDPVPGATVIAYCCETDDGQARLIQPDGEEYVRCWCNGVAEIEVTGRVTLIESITPGAYTLEVTPADGKARTYPVSVVEGQTVTVAIQ